MIGIGPRGSCPNLVWQHLAKVASSAGLQPSLASYFGAAFLGGRTVFTFVDLVNGVIDGQPVAFLAYRHFQHPIVKNMKMEHRLVVLPDFQGLSIGARLSEWVGQHLAEQGFRYRSVSSHPALISYRDRSPRWQRQARARKLSTTSTRPFQHGQTLDPRRLGLVSFEYIPLTPA